MFDADVSVVHEPNAAELAGKMPFLVKVSILDLNIRKGPGRITAGCSFVRLVFTRSLRWNPEKVLNPDGEGLKAGSDGTV